MNTSKFYYLESPFFSDLISTLCNYFTFLKKTEGPVWRQHSLMRGSHDVRILVH